MDTLKTRIQDNFATLAVQTCKIQKCDDVFYLWLFSIVMAVGMKEFCICFSLQMGLCIAST